MTLRSDCGIGNRFRKFASRAARGAGLVRNKYSGAYSATDHGLAVLLGVRYRWNERIGARLDANEDFVTSPANETPQVTYNSNFAVHVGVSVLLDWRRSVARR